MNATQLSLLLTSLQSLLDLVPTLIGMSDKDLTPEERVKLRDTTRALRDRATALSDTLS